LALAAAPWASALDTPPPETRVFPGAGHDEGAWAERLEIPLAFVAGR
jgi:hypothetical protein